MNTRLVALGLALTLMLGSVAAFATPGTTEQLAKDSFTAATAPREPSETVAMTADLSLLAEVIAEARKDVRLGADPSETLTRLISQRSVSFNEGGSAWLTAEDVEQCRTGQVVWKISFWGGIVDGCDPGSMFVDPFGAHLSRLEGYVFHDISEACVAIQCLGGHGQRFRAHHTNPELDAALQHRGREAFGVVIGQISGTYTTHAGGFSSSMNIDMFPALRMDGFYDPTMDSTKTLGSDWNGNDRRYTGTWAQQFEPGKGKSWAIADLTGPNAEIVGQQTFWADEWLESGKAPPAFLAWGDAAGISLEEERKREAEECKICSIPSPVRR